MKQTRLFQLFRHSVQIFSVLFVVYTALSMYWRNFKTAHNSSRIVRLLTNEFTGEMYWYNERFLALFGDPQQISDGLLGGPWAATFAGFPLTDPLSLAALLASGVNPPTAMWLGAVSPILLALVFGRVFCSFLCPARLAFEIGGQVRKGLIWLGLDLPSVRLPRLGLWVGLGTVLFAASGGAAIFHFALPYLSISASIIGYVFTGAAVTAMTWTALMLFVDVFVAPGQICHALCPTGAVLEQLGRTSVLALVRTGGDCPPSCDLCQRACPYGLFPGRQTHRPACDSCGRCTVVCPKNKLRHRLQVPFAKLAKAAVVLTLLALGASAAQAHHNKGLPHYGYFDNYPQVPTEEFIDEVGRWEVGAVFFNFQGLKRQTSDTPDDIRIFAYIYDLERDRGYKEGLTLHLETPEGERFATFNRLESDGEGVYVVRQQMPESGDYTLIFEFETDGATVAVPLDFDIDLSADRFDWYVLGGAVAVFAVVFGLAFAGRKKRGLRAAPAAIQEA